ncbi:cytochrome c biogenesis CcdA family protein [uncultured Methanomethylovorans sp.]|uniref:cytochrome c biogenesis CcdA family protein n=1 Tax=uncultured Methanomethylovorans sp. TaxID=183759 RepID=UPI002AA8658F|nr:cytochrome c biogenesis CcdA family protein [uncultured Methanomethylovorans sp.]
MTETDLSKSMMTTDISPLAILLAGIISVLSPCTLPLLPAILAFSTKEGKYGPLAVIAGLVIAFTSMGVVTSAFGALLISYIPYLHLIASITIVLFGIVMLFDLQVFNWLFIFTSKVHNSKKQGILGGVLLGLSLGIVWIPCVGPLLGSVLVLVAVHGNLAYGASLLFIYSIGFALPMLIIAYSANVSAMRLRNIARYDFFVKKIAGILLVVAGLWMAYTSQMILLF